MVDWIGRTLSKVTIQKLIGRGGMAEVFLGLHTTLNRPVAVKVLHGHLLEDDTSMVRFRSEAQAVANMRHPNIIQVYDFDIVEDQPYIVMELLEGPSLADYLGALRQAKKTLPADTASRLISAIAQALEYAHARGIVHRDVKPSNVLLRRESGALDPKAPLPEDVQPVLTDFGVARMSDAAVRTASGAIVGTPAYMSPEQVSGIPIDARSDIYSLGIMVYEMLSGQLPFGVADDDSVASTLIKHITEIPAPLPNATPAVQAVVARALSKKPEARYQHAGEMAAELRVALGLPLTPVEMMALSSRSSGVITKSTLLGTTARMQALRRQVSSHSALTLVVIVLLIAAAALAVVVGSGILETDDSGTDTDSDGSAPALEYGTFAFANSEAQNDGVMVKVTNLPPPSDGMQYEVWFLGNETRTTVGVLEVAPDGSGELTFSDDTGNNLLGTFGRFEITVEPSPDLNPLPTGNIVFSGAIPTGVLTHVRHLLFEFGGAPERLGLTLGIMRDAGLITEIAQAIVDAQEDNDLEEMKRQAEGLVNLIEGEGGNDFGDLDGDGETLSPSDGFGLLPGAASGGYIQTSIEHARFAAGSADATPNAIQQAAKLEVAAQNLGGWAAQLRDSAMEIVESGTAEEASESAQRILELADLFLHGQDVNGNGEIEPILDEGGAETVYFYAQRMADMPVLAGRDQVPAPAATNPAPNAAPEASADHVDEHGY